MNQSPQNERSMSPAFLVASPRLDGSPFERAVILLVHHDLSGAMGYIINKPVDVDFGTLISSVNTEIESKILADRFQKAVYFGGPVRLEQLWVLYTRSGEVDRKSTRLNSSHVRISYAVFCLKKKSCRAGAAGA